MKRIAAGILIAPLIWPWVFDPVTTLAYIALTGTTVHHYWLAPLHNLHLFGWAYALMIVFGGPFVYLGISRKWQKQWPYLVIGTSIGLVVPILFVTYTILFELQGREEPAFTLFLTFLQSNIHLISGITVASGAMFVVYWAIGVRGNSIYEAAT